MTPHSTGSQPPDPQMQRACGAACLSLVYKSFGKDLPAAAIWPAIAKPNRFGSVASTTHLMTLHALSQGLNAVAIQARHPLHVLRICLERGIAAILNHRSEATVATGHFSVLTGVDDKNVFLNDPSFGGVRRLSHAEFLQLWQPLSSPSEILGSVLIGIAAEPDLAPPCEVCHTEFPPKIDCPKCGQATGLKPSALLGCIRDGCIARMWNYVCCPSCDYVWTFSEAKASTSDLPRAASPSAAPAAPAGPDLDKLFVELDKFCAHLLAIPGAAEHADLKAQLAVIAAGKDKLRLAQAEELASFKARSEELAARQAESAQNLEAHRKKVQERDSPPPPLDGAALGQALLEKLGLK